MGKLLKAAIILGILLFVPGVALAVEGPHGGFTSTTDACAGCHRAHTAQGARLLVSTNTALCQTCHGSGGLGSDVNVDDGVFTAGRQGNDAKGTNGATLNGGGFLNLAAVDPGLTGTPQNLPATSQHSIEAVTGYSPSAVMWGSGPISPAPTADAGGTWNLYCTSCHDPHGSPNYRTIKTTVNGVAVTVTPTDEATKSYTTPKYWKDAGQWEISAFCGACHTRYLAVDPGSGGNSSTDAIFTFRHRVDVTSGSQVNGVTYTFPSSAGGALKLPVSTTGGAPTEAPSPDNRVMVCLTCHYAHGTAATMGYNSGGVPWPGGTAGASGNGRSSLLRINNRGICENCHAK